MRPILLAAIVVTAACAYERPPAYADPPAGSYSTAIVTFKNGDMTASVQGASVSPAFFAMPGVPPFLGRFFIPADYTSATRVVVISNDLWAAQFGSSPAVIGREVSIDGHTVTIVGVAPRGFQFPSGTMLWIPAK